ncbi:MAG TPA: hypothetical protein PKY63_09490 [Bacteroidales bacterium]|nr:hypothetical protein [Bacteroidales bacterium]
MNNQLIILIVLFVYLVISAYSVLWISRNKLLERAQKIRNICITLLLPFWIIIVRSALKPFKYKETNDRGWIRQEHEGSVRGTWIGGMFNQSGK